MRSTVSLRRALFVAIIALLASAGRAAAQTETIEYYGTDAVGSVRIVFNASGAVVARQDYGPFGQEILAAPGMSPERFGGQTADSDLQQAYFHARQLQARTGRFGTTDPVFNGVLTPQGWNRYTYVSNSPLTLLDPDGEEQFRSGVVGCDSYDHHSKEWFLTCSPESPTPTMWSDLFPPTRSPGGFGPGRPAPEPPGNPNQPTPSPEPPNPPPGPPPTPDPPQTTRQCYERWQFSSLFPQGAARTAAQVVEIGAPVSVLGDLRAATLKGARPGALGSPELWASGINRLFRATTPTAWRGVTNAIGDTLTPALAVLGVGTASYNMTIWVECATGVIK
jgi:RHS repeat-associated protein